VVVAVFASVGYAVQVGGREIGELGCVIGVELSVQAPTSKQNINNWNLPGRLLCMSILQLEIDINRSIA